MATMTDQPQDKPILKRFRAALGEMYGDRLERVVLHGARGAAHEGSDYEVAVFLRDMPDRIAELHRVADLSAWRAGGDISSVPRGVP